LKIKDLRPSEIITTRDFPVHNLQILKIYFKICKHGDTDILPPTPVVPLSAGLPLLKGKTKGEKGYNKRINDYVKNNRKIRYILCDGSHKTTALTLTNNLIRAVILSSDEDIKEVKELVKTGDVFSMTTGNTIKNELKQKAIHLKGAKFFETVQDKTDRMVREKVIPDFMIRYYKRKAKE